ncbi:hypothetical protein SAMN02983003_0966 [Devosia enhydra]|uniref:GatB/YqeY domain-containing protein n=1 Tax=Devosia enhydra TaxID=665118 RepID=A0A1K2HUS4_9HYPH|nr:GatB/YqeY domain-containing protein [Devosia enhydra]SFZ82252.1 hypothetical protein SAMN02983003_0966 [Devosia enhydra]
MRDAINEAYKQAMKARDARRTATLRAVNAAIKDKDIEARGLGKDALSDADLLPMLQKMVKQREESLSIYEKAGREDLALVEREEIAILAEFLPRAMTAEETEAAIRDAIAETGAEGMKDMGKVIALLRGKYPGRMDFGKVSGQVKAALG